jgi:uncharacterized phage protein (TIGR01671 family)
MDRQIKFRAYDPENKRMSYSPINIAFNSDGTLTGTAIFKKGLSVDVIGKDSLIWQQFTGLKDKNGKEIYEGDVVKWDEEYFEEMGWKTSISTIEFSEGAFLVGPAVLGHWVPSSQVEVLGNRYEHPNLLKKEMAE